MLTIPQKSVIESLPVGFSYPMQVNFWRIFSIIIVIFKLIFSNILEYFLIFLFGSIDRNTPRLSILFSFGDNK